MAINSYIHVTAAGADTKDGTTWAKAMGEAELETFLENTVVAGDVIFVKEGTYTLDSTIDSSARDGTAISPIAIIGVKSGTTNEGASVVYTDWASGANRPFFDGVTYQFKVGDYYIIRNIDVISEIDRAFETGTYPLVENCKFTNDYGTTSDRYALYTGTGARVINNEIISAKGAGFRIGQGGHARYNYVHNVHSASVGAINVSSYGSADFNILNDCTIGIVGGSQGLEVYNNNSFYDCDTAISLSTANPLTVINNTISNSATDGIKSTTQTDCNFFWNNHFYNNADDLDGIDETTCFKDYLIKSGDPKFKTAGSDFELDTGSPCLDTGMSITLGV